MKYLQHTSETSETLETNVYDLRFSTNPGRWVGERSIAQRDPAMWVAVEKKVAMDSVPADQIPHISVLDHQR